MSASITGLKLSSRYCAISDSTSSASSGTPPGMISGAGSSRSHSAWMTADISRSTPRVRWNRSSVDQSWYSRSNSSGWIGYADVIRSS